MFKVPITNDPNQSFPISIPLNNSNKLLELFIGWNRIAGYWQMNITDSASGTELITALPLLTSKGNGQNILQQYSYMNIGSAYVVPISTKSPDYPGIGDWGTNFFLVWGP